MHQRALRKAKQQIELACGAHRAECLCTGYAYPTMVAALELGMCTPSCSLQLRMVKRGFHKLPGIVRSARLPHMHTSLFEPSARCLGAYIACDKFSIALLG